MGARAVICASCCATAVACVAPSASRPGSGSSPHAAAGLACLTRYIRGMRSCRARLLEWLGGTLFQILQAALRLGQRLLLCCLLRRRARRTGLAPLDLRRTGGGEYVHGYGHRPAL